MKKLMWGVVLVAVSSAAFAGGLGKAVVGGVVGGAVAGVVVNSMSNKQSPANTIQTSDTLLTSEHHTITCVTETGYDCDAFYARNGTRNLTPAQFAGKAGYKALWKVLTLITADKVFLVLKVSK